ncbi:lysophospholipid acyltransferase family protein [Desulfatirhabdium butyrativorans]|uniref:lysophospholipid acyltransferase family protein n=1 Tax=Desulfatirhabdium butyrativorans TaxID=340467 RepID=UPI0005590367|nr:lysophospholipid acyltransferase family protein [Desulfatirhabdium butyrativorans]
MLLWSYWYPFRRLIQGLTVPRAYFIAEMMGNLLYCLAGNKRKAFEKELYTIFGRKSDLLQIRLIVRKAFIHWCRSEVEMMLYSKMNATNISMFVEIEGLDHLDRALAAGKGVMLLFSHFGANQMIMPAMGYHGYPMSQLSAPATVWTEKLSGRKFSRMEKKALEMRWRQESFLPVTHINIFGSLKAAFTCLKKNEILGVAIDGGGGQKKVMVDFLGKTALFSTGPLEIAARTNCRVLPTFMVRSIQGKSRMIIEEPMEIRNTDRDVFVSVHTQMFATRLESYVRKYPCHYLQFLSLRAFMASVDGAPFLME